tara:strand:- start:829 stop:1023 length:195 start_codon:yes stop_codon:yes gene_type:complete
MNKNDTAALFDIEISLPVEFVQRMQAVAEHIGDPIPIITELFLEEGVDKWEALISQEKEQDGTV